METHYQTIQKRVHKSFQLPKINGILLLVALLFVTLVSSGQELISYNSSWKYAPESINPLPLTSPKWYEPEFVETNWQSGAGVLGFGNVGSLPKNTTLTRRDCPTCDNYPVYYFRYTIENLNKALYSGFKLQTYFDDAIVVYVNGQEVGRKNMTLKYPGDPTKPYAGSNPAVVDSAMLFLSPGNSLFVNGKNVIAVEVHQAGETSSDLLFALQLEGIPIAGNGLIPYGSTWKYAPESINPLPVTSPKWYETEFIETNWKSGMGALGFGNVGSLPKNTTLIRQDCPTCDNYPVYYFRYTIENLNKALYSGFKLKTYFDDAIVVYVNGQEVGRKNMTLKYPGDPTKPYAGSNPGVVDSAMLFLNPGNSLFVNGKNVIAVEVHQAGETSSDILFDLQLEETSQASISLIRYPYLQLPSHDQMTVRWSTNQPSSSTVRYSANSNMSGFVDIATPTNTTKHSVTLTGLQPNTMYYYLVGYETGTNFVALQNNTAATNFHTLPAPSDTSHAMRFWILGDSGAGADSILNPRPYKVRDAYLAYLLDNQNGAKPDAALFIGDNSKKQGFEGEQLAIDTSFFKFYNRPYDRQLLSNIPFWTIMGNHDYDSTSILFEGIKYKIKKAYHKQTAASFSTFAFPDQGQIGGVATNNQKGYYSFNQGDVHFVVLNPYLVEGNVTGVEWDGSNDHVPPVQGETNLNRVLGPSIVFGSNENVEALPQVIWLRQDLAANTKKWTVVTFHLPPFTTLGHHEDEYDIRNVRNRLLPILEDPQYKVDMVLVSHSHAYLRGGMVRKTNGVRKTDFVKNGNLGKYTTNAPYIKSTNEAAYSYLLTGSAGRGAPGDGDDGLNSPGVSELPLDVLGNNDFYHVKGGSVELLFRENRLDVKFIRENDSAPGYLIDDNYVVMKDVNKTTLLSSPYGTTTFPLRASWVGNYQWSVATAPNTVLSTARTFSVTPTITTTYHVRDGYGHLVDTFQITSIDLVQSVQTGSWHNPTTWDCNCVPNQNHNVQVNATHTVTISDGDALLKSLHKNGGNVHLTNGRKLCFSCSP